MVGCSSGRYSCRRSTLACSVSPPPGRSSFCGAPSRLGQRQQQVGRHAEAGAAFGAPRGRQPGAPALPAAHCRLDHLNPKAAGINARARASAASLSIRTTVRPLRSLQGFAPQKPGFCDRLSFTTGSCRSSARVKISERSGPHDQRQGAHSARKCIMRTVANQ